MAELVKASEILEGTGKVKPVTWSQEAGLKLAIGVGVLGVLVILVLIVNWWEMRPPLPVFTASETQEQAQSAINNYKALSLEARDSAIQLFDAFIVRALLPVFTSIVGFIFGKEVGSKGSA